MADLTSATTGAGPSHPLPMVVMGAGLAGLLAASEMVRAGRGPVLVLEKSRGWGGRMATKRLGEIAFDQGAQYFTARHPDFKAHVAAWAEAGVVQPWPGWATAGGNVEAWVGRPTMNAVGRHLARGLEVRRETRVVAARWSGTSWKLELEPAGTVEARGLVLTAPVPQSLEVLRAGGWDPVVEEPELAEVRYDPCLAVLLQLDRPSAVPGAGGLEPRSPILGWLADNARKGVAVGPAGAITLHATPVYSAEHYTAPEAEIVAALTAEARPWLGEAEVVATALHRWKYSRVARSFGAPCWAARDRPLLLAGDGFGGPRVEGAALSGLAAGQRAAAACSRG